MPGLTRRIKFEPSRRSGRQRRRTRGRWQYGYERSNCDRPERECQL